MAYGWVKHRFNEIRQIAMEDFGDLASKGLDDELSGAVAAATAMIAFADADSITAEKERIVDVFEREAELEDLDFEALFGVLDRLSDAYIRSGNEGVKQALGYLGEYRDDPATGEVVLRTALAAGSADGEIGVNEEDALEAIADAMGLDLDDVMTHAVAEYEGEDRITRYLDNGEDDFDDDAGDDDDD
ncbi:MAG: TerB family tellurite resistance protein [Geminicoccaceae bacterium]